MLGCGLLLVCLVIVAAIATDSSEPIDIRTSVEIDRPLNEVFAFVSNVENDVQWRTNVKSLRNLTPPPTGVGTRSIETLTVFGKPLETVTEVIEFVPNQRVARKTVSGPTPVQTLRSVQQVATGTRFTYAVSVDVSGVWVFKVLKPLMKVWYQRKTQDQMQALRTLLERKQPSAGS